MYKGCEECPALRRLRGNISNGKSRTDKTHNAKLDCLSVLRSHFGSGCDILFYLMGYESLASVVAVSSCAMAGKLPGPPNMTACAVMASS